MTNISKRFGAVQALDNVQFELRKGEVHALVGENGAGKSTFLNIMSGTYQQDTGKGNHKGSSGITADSGIIRCPEYVSRK